MQHLPFETLRCFWFDVLHYNLRSAILATKGSEFGEEMGCRVFAVRGGCLMQIPGGKVKEAFFLSSFLVSKG